MTLRRLRALTDADARPPGGVLHKSVQADVMTARPGAANSSPGRPKVIALTVSSGAAICSCWPVSGSQIRTL